MGTLLISYASEAQKVSKVDLETWRPALGLWQPMLVWFCCRNRSCAYPARGIEQRWWKFEIPTLQMLCSLASPGPLEDLQHVFLPTKSPTWKTPELPTNQKPRFRWRESAGISADPVFQRWFDLSIQSLDYSVVEWWMPFWRRWYEGLLLIAIFLICIYLLRNFNDFANIPLAIFPPKERHVDTDDSWISSCFFQVHCLFWLFASFSNTLVRATNEPPSSWPINDHWKTECGPQSAVPNWLFNSPSAPYVLGCLTHDGCYCIWIAA